MLKIDSRLKDMNDPESIENFNRVLKICGASISKVSLAADSTGKITGGSVTISDKTTVPITVTTAS